MCVCVRARATLELLKRQTISKNTEEIHLHTPDNTIVVQILCDFHRLLRGHAQLARGERLQLDRCQRPRFPLALYVLAHVNDNGFG